MILTSTIKTNRPHKSFWSFILTLILVFGLFQGFGPKTAQGSNNYINNFSFHKVGDHYIFQFHVITSFTNKAFLGGGPGSYSGSFFGYSNAFYDYHYAGYWRFDDGDYSSFITPTPNCYPWPEYPYQGYYVCDFVAGNTYQIQGDPIFSFYGYPPSPTHITPDKLTFTNTDYFTLDNYFFPSGDPITAYYVETPTLTITYPLDNYELLTNFYVTGSFTQPATGSPSHFLQLDTMPAGTWSSSLVSFWQAIYGNATGTVSIWVGGLSAGYYDFRIYFRSDDWDFYQGAIIQNIHIVNDLPPGLPPWAEQPPSTAPPVFNPLDPTTYCTENSTYATCTAMYYAITGTFAPVLLSVGQNMVEFASRFTQSNASSTGNQLGASILLVRTYISNLNSFFADFPVGQFLLLYLIALVVIIVLRLGKGLINLFKI